MDQLKARIAEALGWTVEETNTFSLASLREILRPVSPKLVHELDFQIQSGAHITANQPKPKRRRF